MGLGTRVVIIGASGSGKSTLAQALGQQLAIEVIDLDRVHWLDKVGVKRDEDDAKRIVGVMASKHAWIIEGVFGWLSEVALPRASALIWLDLPWCVCREGLEQRGPWRGASATEHADFLEWAEAYWTRQTPSSFAGHRALFDGFAGFKRCLQSRADIAAFLERQGTA